MEMLNDKQLAKITAPVALHWDSTQESTLIEQLMKELASQREKSLALSNEIVEKRKRNMHIETCLNQVLSQVPQVASWASFNETLPEVNSTGSMKELMTSACFVSKSASFSSISTTPESPWFSVPNIETWNSIAGDCFESTVTSCKPSSATVGAYPAHIRQAKIRTYKEKQQKYRAKFAVSRVFNGRSQAALKKLRVNGKFVKAEVK